jgi:SAM-dependent methyltransferase
LPGDQTLADVYATTFNYAWYRDHLPGKLADCRMRLKEYQERNLLGTRILDFGGGLGYFSQTACQLGYQSITFDPFVSESLPAKGVWNTLVAHHVLEHSNDLDRMLAQIKELLVSEGNVVIAVPNFSALGYKTLAMRWVWAQPPLLHIHHFSAAGLRALLKRHGFRNIQVSCHERWDANYYCDVRHARLFGLIGKLWGMPLLRRLEPYRRLVAAIATALRFRGLRLSIARPAADPGEYSELQIAAVAPRR